MSGSVSYTHLLVILDVMMPKMDGWQVCREIREHSKVPIIMLTARSDERDELQGFDPVSYTHLICLRIASPSSRSLSKPVQAPV